MNCHPRRTGCPEQADETDRQPEMKLLFTDQTDTASLKCCDVRQGGQKEQNNSQFRKMICPIALTIECGAETDQECQSADK